MARSKPGTWHCAKVYGSLHSQLSYTSLYYIFKMATLEDLKSPATNENNAGQATPLDHLGSIAGRLRSNSLKWSESNGDTTGLKGSLKSLDDVSHRPFDRR